MVALRSGTYTNVPNSVTGDVDQYRPKVRHVAGKPMFLY